jgi:hypothetical protein
MAMCAAASRVLALVEMSDGVSRHWAWFKGRKPGRG